MSFTRFRLSLCFTFFLQSPFFTIVGSKVGVAVGALASHLCDPVRFQWLVCGLSLLLVLSLFRRVSFRVHLDVKCLHMMCGPHTTTQNLIYLFFLLHMLDTYS